MRRFHYATLCFILSILLAGCGAQPPTQTQAVAQPPVASAGIETLRQNAANYLQNHTAMPLTAQEVFENLSTLGSAGYYLVDIRNDEHYAKHHIPGAIHIAYADAWRAVKTDYLPRDRKIVIIDYSGHSSSQIAAYWSLLGLDAVAMKHGMAGWSKDKDVIGGSPLPCEPRNYPTSRDREAASFYDAPALESKAAQSDELLRQRGETLATKPVVIQADELLAKVNAKNIFVLDVRTSNQYNAGHIVGALNIPFKSLMDANALKQLPPDRQIAVISEDGHHASQAARLLNLLGYDSLALRDGMSIWTRDEAIIGASPVSCVLPERKTAQLNAPLSPSPSAAAT